ncbi:MAG TPA: hypothetical protein VM554_02120 [Acidisarcina sp.]|nr:hypothetical protein [Acidisarcina sp.]
MFRILKSYFYWTYPRGSFHYDVMVTLILAIIFLSPRVINFHDQPMDRELHSTEVLVKTEGANGLFYRLSEERVKQFSGEDETAALKGAIQPISGEVVIDRYEVVKDESGHTTGYKVWAHR